MRVLDKNEVSEVSGGTLCLIGGLLGGIFGLLRKPAVYCKPAPVCPPPAPKGHC